MSHNQTHWLILLLSILIVTSTLNICNANESYRNEVPDSLSHVISFKNRSGKRVEVHWMHPDTHELVLQSNPDIQNGGVMILNSFVGHMFQIRELPSAKTGACEDEVCLIGFMTVTSHKEQGLSVIHEDSMSLAENYSRDAVNMCANEVNMKAQSSSSAEAIDMMSECVLNKLTPRIQLLRDEISFQAEIRSDISLKLENYTCADINLPTTESLENVTWTYGDVKRNIQKLLNRDASKIYTIENFISVDECKAMEEAAKPTLHRATVADGEGGSRVTDSRKAMQAGIAVPWHEEVNGNPIVALSRRVYDFTNTVNGFQLQPDGQEDLMSIQYFGENYENGEQPDRYMPHCDGNCDGSPHVWGNRVATMVMYCEIPEIGGATQFGNAAIHIKPKAGMATFFSYMGSDGNMDNGFTQHSGCPVLKGDKKIVTQWMRYGVDRQNPWNSFNTLGVQPHDE